MKSEIKPISDTTGRIRLADAVPLNTPFGVYVYPTTFCNFKCLYCAHSLGTERMKKEYGFSKEMMSMETFHKAIEQLALFPEKIKMLSLTGQGEPLLNKNIPQMIRTAKTTNRFERIEIISNGALLTPKLADALVESGLDILRISLQGLSSKRYSEMCGADVDFEKFMETIRYLYSIRGDTKLFVKVLNEALYPGEEKIFYALFESCSDRMFIEQMHATYDGVEFTAGLERDVDRYGRKIEKRSVCPLAFFMLGIYPNGDVQPCDSLYKPTILGNVHTSTIPEMFADPVHREFWKLHLEGKRHTNAGCARCCAPDDVSHPEDVLDFDTDAILKKIKAL